MHDRPPPWPPITTRLPLDMIERIDTLAETDGVDRSTFIRRVLGSELARREAS